MSNNQPYDSNPLNRLTPELIKGFVNGTLSPDLMEKVERYLQENSFEAEAVEGIKSHSIDLDQELTVLDKQLSNEILSKSRKPARYILPAAAAITLLLISGLLIYILLAGQPEITPIAVNQDTAISQNQSKAETNTPDAAPIPENRPSETADGETVTAVTPIQKDPDITRQAEVTATDHSKASIEELEQVSAINEEIAETVTDMPVEQEIEETVVENAFDEAPALEKAAQFNSAAKSRKSAPGLVTAAAPEPVQSIELPMAQAPAEWIEYLSSQLHYPTEAKDNGIEGTVKIKFQVDVNGNPRDLELVQKLGYGCDQEALRVLRNGPSWQPDTINGVPVVSMAEIEIKFSLP